MKNYISPLELIDILKPKIKKELNQTDIQDRADLEQEIICMILDTYQKNKFQKLPTFFELLQKERHN